MNGGSAYPLPKTVHVSLQSPDDLCFYSMQQALTLAKGKRIQLITLASPPAGKPPNITGIVKDVGSGLLMLQLEHGEGTESPRIGVYSIRGIIGFVPASKEDGEECESEKKNL